MSIQTGNVDALSIFDLDRYERKHSVLTCSYCLASDYTYNPTDGTYLCYNCDKTFINEEVGL